MIRTFARTLFRSFSFRIGALFLALTILTYTASVISIAREQALTPGEKSLGVAALAMTFAVPLFFFATIAFVSFVVSIGAATRRALAARTPPSPGPAPPLE